MFINGRFYSRSVLFAPNDGGESTGAGGAGNSDKTPEGKNSDPDNGGKDKGGNETVPYGRFKEVNDENKSLKARLAEFESEKAKAEAEKKKQEEAEAKKESTKKSSLKNKVLLMPMQQKKLTGERELQASKQWWMVNLRKSKPVMVMISLPK